MTRKRNACVLPVFIVWGLAMLGLFTGAVVIPWRVSQVVGPAGLSLSSWERVSFSLQLFPNLKKISTPADSDGVEKQFVIESGDGAAAISERLEQAGLICCARVFQDYLSWKGMDKTIQTGTFRLSPTQSGVEIAAILASKSMTEVEFSVLAGWRMEEIAASLPTSGLAIAPTQFLAEAASTRLMADILPAGKSTEGFLFPGTYLLGRDTSAPELVAILLQRFYDSLPADTRAAFTRQGLTTFEAVTLASIIQREAVVADEMPMIASVFHNRLAAGMKLQSDPTVQYALGYDQTLGTWWKTPLSSEDLLVDSPYNTYLATTLPPGPICNPGQAALQAVAFPAQSPYYYFQARCDGSGWHNFAETYDQHLANNCP